MWYRSVITDFWPLNKVKGKGQVNGKMAVPSRGDRVRLPPLNLILLECPNHKTLAQHQSLAPAGTRLGYAIQQATWRPLIGSYHLQSNTPPQASWRNRTACCSYQSAILVNYRSYHPVFYWILPSQKSVIGFWPSIIKETDTLSSKLVWQTTGRGNLSGLPLNPFIRYQRNRHPLQHTFT
jgi:hypothetical protein